MARLRIVVCVNVVRLPAGCREPLNEPSLCRLMSPPLAVPFCPRHKLLAMQAGVVYDKRRRVVDNASRSRRNQEIKLRPLNVGVKKDKVEPRNSFHADDADGGLDNVVPLALRWHRLRINRVDRRAGREKVAGRIAGLASGLKHRLRTETADKRVKQERFVVLDWPVDTPRVLRQVREVVLHE